MGDSVCSCSLCVQEDLTGEQALIQFIVWKGNKCSDLLYKLRLKQQLIKELGFTLKFLSEPACSLQFDLHWGSVFSSRLRTRVFSVLFSFVNWILSGSWSRHKVISSKLLSEPAWSLQVDLHWASPHLPWILREYNVFADICFLEFIYVFWEILSTSMLFAARFTLRQP